MYKIIIADDKIQERDYLNKYITENFKGHLFPPRVARDGEEALMMVKSDIPDIILLDIQMPKIDGLEVAAQLSKSNPEIKIVLITAYAEFSYAREAIKLGVSEYLLKPYTDEELNEVIHKVILSLDQKKKQKKELYVDIKPLHMKDFHEKSIISKVIQKNVDYHYYEKYFTSLFNQDLMFKCVVIFEESIHNQGSDTMDVVRSFFEKNNLKLLADLDGKEKILFLFGEKTIDFNELDSSIKRTRKYLSDSYQEEVYIGVSGFYKSIEDLFVSYEDAVSLILNFGYNTLKSEYDQNKRYKLALINSESSIKLHVLNKDEKEALDGLNIFIDVVLARRPVYFREKRLLYLAYELIKNIYNVLGREEEGIIRVLSFLETNEGKENSLEKLTKVLSDLIKELIISLGDLSVYNNIAIVKEAKTFISSNFRQKISLSDVAESVGISYGYLSKCFKQVEGTTFNNYLMKVRMEESKDLMSNTDLSINEISYMVGIGDANYFSKCFRKYSGITPKEFITMTIGDDFK